MSAAALSLPSRHGLTLYRTIAGLLLLLLLLPLDAHASESPSAATSSQGKEAKTTDDGSPGDANGSKPNQPQGEDGAGAYRNWRGDIKIGGHLSIPNNELRGESGYVDLGAGLGILVGMAPQSFPLLFGLSFGFDSFLVIDEQYLGASGEFTKRLSRDSYWVMPMLYLIPSDGMVRPFARLTGGMWLHDSTVKNISEDGITEKFELGADPTWAYGISIGLDWRLGEKTRLGLSLLHQRGQGTKTLSVSDPDVVSGASSLIETESGPMRQWTISLEVGGGI